jgi:hypothetical protein
VIREQLPCVNNLMARTLRSLTRRWRRSDQSSTAPQAAPGGLRQRVLGAVRGEANVEAHAIVHKRRLWLAASVLLAAVLATAATATLDQSSARPHRSTARDIVTDHTMRASLRRSGAHTELVVSNMPAPPIGEIYEVWLVRTGAPAQATDALFTVTSAGDGAVEVPGGLRRVREVMVTSEPLGGSSSPTSAAVLRVHR